LAEPLEVTYGFGADYHPFDTYIEQLFYRGFVTQSAADFDFELLKSGYRRYRIGVNRLADLSSVQIDNMQPLGPGGAKFPGLLDRVILIGYLAMILALDKSDTFTVPQVNCRYNNIKIQISNVQNILFRILYFGHLNLFRISDFVLRISKLNIFLSTKTSLIIHTIVKQIKLLLPNPTLH